jgi:carboxylesterase
MNAEAWEGGAGDRGVLLIHGFSSVPTEMSFIGEILAKRGYFCRAPLLPGHGGAKEEMTQFAWHEWVEGAQGELDAINKRCRQVFVVGQSMGGAIAINLAANNPQLAGMVCMATPLRLPTYARAILPVLKHVMPWHKRGNKSDLFLPERRDDVPTHSQRSTRAVHELGKLLTETQQQLACVRVPVLVLQGAGDHTINWRDAYEINRRLVCSPRHELHIYKRSGHGMAVDVDREEIGQRIGDWMDDCSLVDEAAGGRAVSVK